MGNLTGRPDAWRDAGDPELMARAWDEPSTMTNHRPGGGRTFLSVYFLNSF